MNVKRFTARTSRDALALVRQAFGDDAVVMSTRPCPEGVEVLAMAPESVQQLERVGVNPQPARPSPAAAPVRAQINVVQPREAPQAREARPASRALERQEPSFDSSVEQDLEQLQMSTLSFQDYVRDRMLKRRDAQLAAEASAAPAAPAPPPVVAPISAARSRLAAPRDVPVLREELRLNEPALGAATPMPAPLSATVTPPGTGRVDMTTASSPKAWRTSARASREVRAVKRLTFMLHFR